MFVGSQVKADIFYHSIPHVNRKNWIFMLETGNDFAMPIAGIELSDLSHIRSFDRESLTMISLLKDDS